MFVDKELGYTSGIFRVEEISIL